MAESPSRLKPSASLSRSSGVSGPSFAARFNSASALALAPSFCAGACNPHGRVEFRQPDQKLRIRVRLPRRLVQHLQRLLRLLLRR